MFITRLTDNGMLIPEKGHQDWHLINNANLHLAAMINSAQGHKSRALAGSLIGTTLTGVVVQFVLASGAVELVTFADTAIVQNGKRQVYFADRVSGNIVSFDIPGQADTVAEFIDHSFNEDLFLLATAGSHNNTTTTSVDFIKFLAKMKNQDVVQLQADFVPVANDDVPKNTFSGSFHRITADTGFKINSVVANADDILICRSDTVGNEPAKFGLLQAKDSGREKGLFFPALGGTATYTTQLGTYVKVGDLVHFKIDLHVALLGTGSPSVIQGLPFLSESAPAGSANISYFAGLANSVVFIGGYIQANAQWINLYSLLAGGNTTALNALFQDGSQVVLSGTYIAAS